MKAADSPDGASLLVANALALSEAQWYVLRIKPYQEKRVVAQLSRRDIEHYCPLLKVFRRDLITGRRQVEPFFPCYLFARINLTASYEEIRRLGGVRDVLRFGNFFPCVAPQVITELRRRETPAGYIRVRLGPRKLVASEAVIITNGLFTGQKGLFTRYLNGPERVCILLNFLERQVRVAMPAAVVRPLVVRAI